MSDKEKSSLQPIDLIAILRSFFRLLGRTWPLVLVAAALLGALAGARSYLSYRPLYRCQAVLSAQYTSVYTNATDIQSYGSNYSSTVSTKQIVSTFSSIITTDAMREQMLARLGTDTINGSIVPQSIANSNLFTLTVTSSDAQSAYDVLMAVIDCYPSVAALVIGNTEIELIEEPVLPTAPTNPRDWQSAAVKGALLGAVLMLALTLLLSRTRTAVHSPSEIRRLTNLTCLGMIPSVRSKRRSKGKTTGLSIQNDALSPAYQEAVRTVRSRVLHRLPADGECKVLMVTSTMPGEGKSTVAANLALSLAQAGKHVVLLDADLRVQSLHAFFGISQKGPGLAELLRSAEPDPVAAARSLPGTTLKLITGAARIGSPASLLHFHKLERIIGMLRAEAQYLVIDTPPIGLLSDAAPFLPFADGVVYVIREDTVSASQISTSLQALSDNKAKLLGYVFNASSQSVGQYGYGRHGYGHYGYGGYGRSGYGGYSGYAGYGKSAAKESG